MISRDEYVETMKAKIDEWNGNMAKLEAKAKEVQEDMRANYETQLAAMRAQREEAEERLKAMRAAGEETWDKMRQGMETAWDNMAKTFQDTASRFGK